VVDGKNQAADIGVAQDYDWSEFTALEDELAGIKTEARLLLLGSVTLITVVSEDGADLLFEEFQLGDRRGGSQVGCGRRQG